MSLRPALLALLTLASLLAPAILGYQVWRRQVTDGVAIVIGSVALFLLVVTRMAQLARQIERQARQLAQLIRVDELTGLPNRRAWSVELPAAMERARRDRAALSIAMLDLDHFKRFNDEYGHQAGDRLLKSAAAAWREQLRAVDQLARYGGEEFIIMLPGGGQRAGHPPAGTAAAGAAGGPDLLGRGGDLGRDRDLRGADRPLRRGPLPGQGRRAGPHHRRRAGPPSTRPGFTLAAPDAAG